MKSDATGYGDFGSAVEADDGLDGFGALLNRLKRRVDKDMKLAATAIIATTAAEGRCDGQNIMVVGTRVVGLRTYSIYVGDELASSWTAKRRS